MIKTFRAASPNAHYQCFSTVDSPMPSRRDVLKSMTAGAGFALGGSALAPGEVNAAHTGEGTPQDLNIVMLVLDTEYRPPGGYGSGFLPGLLCEPRMHPVTGRDHVGSVAVHHRHHR